MTNLPPYDPREEELLLNALDGDPVADAAVVSDPRLVVVLSEMRRNRESLRSASVPIDPSARDNSIAAAMSVFDDMAASRTAAADVAALTRRPRRAQALVRWLAVVATGAVAVIGLIFIGPSFGGSESDSIASLDAPAATLAAPPDAAIALDSTADAAPEAAVEPNDTATRSGAATADEFATPQTALAATTTAAPSIAQDTIDGAPSGEQDVGVDAILAECAVEEQLDVADWVQSTLVDNEGPEGSPLRFVVLLDTGMEIDVEVDPSTCRFAELSEPHAPRPASR